MSWASKSADRLVKNVNRMSPLRKIVGNDNAKLMIASGIGGSSGWQYQYSRNKGMSGSEAQGNTLTKGFNYTQYRTKQTVRMAEEGQKESDAAFAQRQKDEQIKARGQIAARVRRARPDRQPDKNGTVLAGGLGSQGSGGGSPTTFASLLGLV